jgi:hypothetical protein
MTGILCRDIVRLLALALLLVPGAGVAGEQAERALTIVKQMIAAGEVPRNATIKVAFKSGNIAVAGPRTWNCRGNGSSAAGS